MRRLLPLLGALLLLAAPPAFAPPPAQAAARPSSPSEGHGRGSGARKPRFNKHAEGREPAKPPPPTNLPSAAPRLSTQQLGALQGIVHTLSRTASRLAQQGAPRRIATAPAAGGAHPAPPKPKLGDAIRESLGETAEARAQREAAAQAEAARKAEEARLAEGQRLAQEAEAARLKAEQEALARQAEEARQKTENERKAREALEKQRQAEAEDKAKGKAAQAGAEASGKAAGLSKQAEADAQSDEWAAPAKPGIDPPKAQPKPEPKQQAPASEPPAAEESRANASGRAKPPLETEPQNEAPAPRDSGLDFLAHPRPPSGEPPAEAEEASGQPGAQPAASAPEDEVDAGPAASQPAAGVAEPAGPAGPPRGRFAVSGPLAQPDLSEHAAAMLPPAAQVPPEEQAAAQLSAAPLAPSPTAGGGASLYFTLMPARPRELVLAPLLGPGGAPSAKAPTTLVLPGKPEMPDANLPKGLSSIERARTKRKVVALTLDDGPHPEFTSQILSTLARYQVRATFDLVGVQCMKNPQWVKMIAQAGHELASHTYDHFRLPKLPVDEKAYQIDENQRLIGQLTGVTPRFLRPPGGQSDPEVEKLCRERGMVVALWDVGLNDLAPGRSAKDLASTALADTKPGSILLAHDGSQALIDALPAIIEGLRAKGYEFVTLSELASAR